ncbi:hypothetical protein [Noviherbaspirillum aridicola]|uniref:Uncharacterized protein n=1 Tax=Noviherbaspirillum aridicola TaxID=2849687 RepID=A0ABQ4QA52_9BURK|nr:hypothetical protein [Noviherbaspirillum aridicola]GIZ53650.1 hypothetical protein NCCP691_36640 [Noviherbaspirillum aridicola]
MKTWGHALRDAIPSGSTASILSTIAISGCGRQEGSSPEAPVNAISHWVWGDRAKRHHEASTEHTLLGYAIHHASATFWAVFYEKWFGERAERRELGTALAGAAAVSALACFVDYKVAPYRLQPGYEAHLSRPSLFLVYASFGAGLLLHSMTRRPR